ncbi:MAG: hypothetical protein M1820_000771 [Bogoriella megaspora]|nr:MAG: hypothetical protein M1820_000771 [Bogoriella megaspora]
MTAETKGDMFVVNGTKQWVTNGMSADFCTAVVRTGSAGKAGCASLVFTNVEVSTSNLIGKLDEGFKIMMSSFNHERLWIAGNCLRLARVCLEDAYEHALTRQTFGKPLIQRQTIKLKFANMGMQIMSNYALLESLVQIRQNARKAKINESDEANIGGLCALTKVSAAKAVEAAVRECQQIMGALGYTRSGPGVRVERISRDVRVLVIGGGSEEILSEMCVLQEQKDLERLDTQDFPM